MALIRNIIDWINSWFRKPTPPPVPPPPPPPVPPPGPVEDPMETIKKRLLELHNFERTNRGTKVLKRDPRLDLAAQKHNDYMVARNNLSHNEPGRDVGKRVTEAGYMWTWVGENIAKGQRNADEVMNSWMDSSGHRANILNGHYEDVGFGVTKDSNGTWWWTTDFGAF